MERTCSSNLNAVICGVQLVGYSLHLPAHGDRSAESWPPWLVELAQTPEAAVGKTRSQALQSFSPVQRDGLVYMPTFITWCRQLSIWYHTVKDSIARETTAS